MLVGQLPPSSAFAASLRGGPEFRPWTSELYLLAAIVNLLNAANRQRAGKRGNAQIVKPPRPEQKSKPRVLTVEEIMRRQSHATTNN